MPGLLNVSFFVSSARFTWMTNIHAYFEVTGETPEEISRYLSWIPVVFGSIRLVIGGRVIDCFIGRLGKIYTLAMVSAIQVNFCCSFQYEYESLKGINAV